MEGCSIRRFSKGLAAGVGAEPLRRKQGGGVMSQSAPTSVLASDGAGEEQRPGVPEKVE